jgi:hypothetical protein
LCDEDYEKMDTEIRGYSRNVHWVNQKFGDDINELKTEIDALHTQLDEYKGVDLNGMQMQIDNLQQIRHKDDEILQYFKYLFEQMYEYLMASTAPGMRAAFHIDSTDTAPVINSKLDSLLAHLVDEKRALTVVSRNITVIANGAKSVVNDIRRKITEILTQAVATNMISDQIKINIDTILNTPLLDNLLMEITAAVAALRGSPDPESAGP